MLIKIFAAAAAAATVLGAAAAAAADLPRRQAPPQLFTPVPVFTWTGFYAGTHSSYSFSDRQNIRTLGNNDASGGLTNTIGNVATLRRPPSIRSEQDGLGNFGAGVGYNYQLTPGSGFVVGVEADWTWTDLRKNYLYLGPALPANGFIPDPSTFRQGLNWLGTAQGRIGYAFDRLLVYGTGGFAYGDVNYNAKFYNGALGLAYLGRNDGIETGYVYGGGVEYAIPTDSFLAKFNFIGSFLGASAITLKAEYLRYDLGSKDVTVASTGFTPATGSYTTRFETSGSIVRAGFNYKFGAY